MYGDDYEQPPQSEQVPPSPGYQGAVGMGPALEVVELSNGEVVWSVVDAMRSDIMQDDDGSSIYQPRVSTSSDASYPSREGVQVLFKEHKRMGSKGSASSAMSARRNAPSNRPETKVRRTRRASTVPKLTFSTLCLRYSLALLHTSAVSSSP